MEAEADISTKKKRRRIITTVTAVTVLFIWLLYLLLTSSFFLKTTLLPFLSRKLGVRIHAQEINLSPISGTAEVKYLTVGPPDRRIFECEHIHLSGSLLSLPDKVNITKLEIQGVKANLKQGLDGKWNLSQQQQSLKAPNPHNTNKAKAADVKFKLPNKIVLPFKLKIAKVNITDVAFHAESTAAANPFIADISDFNLSLKNLAPSSHADLDIKAKFKLKCRGVAIDKGQLNCDLQADFNNDLMPKKLSFSNTLAVIAGKLNQMNLAGNKLVATSNLSFDGNKFNIGSLKVDYHDTKKISSNIIFTASGSLNPLSAKFKLNAPHIPEIVLDLVENFSGLTGLGFAEASLIMDMSYDNHILSSLSDLQVKHHIAGQEKSRLPELYLDMAENISIDFNKKNLNVKHLNVNIRGINAGTLKVTLSEPFSWNWTAATSSSAIHPVISLTADNLKLSAINPLTAANGFTFGQNGSISGFMSTSFDPRKHCVRLDSKFVGSNLDMSVPDYKISAVGLVAKLTASTTDMKNISFTPTILVQHRGNTVGRAAVQGTMDLPSKLMTFSLNVSKTNKDTLNVLPDVVRELDVMQKLLAHLSPFELKVKADGNLNFRKEKLDITNAEVKVNRQKQGILKINFLSSWPLDLSGKGDVIPEPMNTNVVFDNMDVRFVNMFLPDSQRINSGHINTSLKTRLDIMKDKLDTQGMIKLVSTGMRTGDLELKNVTLASNVYVSMDQWTTLNIKDFTADIYNGKDIAFKFSNSSNFDFDAGNMRIKTRISDLTRKAVEILEPDFPIEFKLNGNTVFSMKDNYKHPLIKAELAAQNITSAQIPAPLAATFNIDIFPNNNSLIINKIEGIIKHKQKNLTDFTINGTVATPLHTGKSKLNLSSNKLNLKLLETILKNNKTPARKKTPPPASPPQPVGPQPEESEPAPIKLNANTEINLNLNNITYGPDITASCSKSILSFKKSMVTINPLNLKVNHSDIILRGTIDLGVAGGYPYALSGSTKELQMGPILHAFSNNRTKTIRGEVNNLSIKLTGKGITRKNLDNSLNGEVKFETKNLSIPDSLKSIRTIRIILLPVESFAQIINYLPTLGTASFSKSLNNARDIYNDVDNLYLKQGKVDLQINSGIVNINDFHFTGDFIQKMDFSGYVPINPDAPMKLVSTLDMYYLAVPLDINGTFNSPEPNVRKMVTYFFPQNIYNIMRSAPVRSIIKGSVSETESILKKTGKIITDGIFGPTSKQDDSKQKENSDLIEKILNE